MERSLHGQFLTAPLIDMCSCDIWLQISSSQPGERRKAFTCASPCVVGSGNSVVGDLPTTYMGAWQLLR